MQAAGGETEGPTAWVGEGTVVPAETMALEVVTTFPREIEALKAAEVLSRRPTPFAVISPRPAYGQVGVTALATTRDGRAVLSGERAITFSGWVEYRPAAITVPQTPPPEFVEDVFGRAAVMVLAPCVADPVKIRIVAHISGDMSGAFPYVSGEMRRSFFNPNGPTLTFMDGHRMISLYARRMAVAKADEIIDGWRALEGIRQLVNDCWARRREIEPCYSMREKPPALEVFKRLPGTNCAACGESTCLAFALRVWSGEAHPSECRPAFDGERKDLWPALAEICAGLGVL